MAPPPFRYPFRGERAVDTLLIGGGLHLLSVYVPVVPLVVVLGYLLAVLGTTATTDRAHRFDTPPRFSEAWPLLRRGVGGSIVLVVFLLPAVAVLLVTVAGLTRRGLSTESITAGVSLGFVAGSTAALLLAVTFVYLLPAALANYVTRGGLHASFDVGFLRRAAADGEYFYNVVTGTVVGALFLALAAVSTEFAVGFFVAFYGEVVMAAYWGGGVARVLPETDGAPTG